MLVRFAAGVQQQAAQQAVTTSTVKPPAEGLTFSHCIGCGAPPSNGPAGLATQQAAAGTTSGPGIFVFNVEDPDAKPASAYVDELSQRSGALLHMALGMPGRDAAPDRRRLEPIC